MAEIKIVSHDDANGDVCDMGAEGYEPSFEENPDILPIFRSGHFSSIYKILNNNIFKILGKEKITHNKLLNLRFVGDRNMTDSFAVHLAILIEEKFSDTKGNPLTFSKRMIQDVLNLIAEQNAFHPVVDFINSLPKWDGTERIKNVNKDILGVEGDLFDVFTKKFFVSLIARPLNPGMQKDELVVLCGDQGIGKTSFFRILAGSWHNDDPVNLKFQIKDAYDTVNSCWIYEFGELSSIKKSDNDSVKLFLSKQFDKYREAYKENKSVIGRQSVAVATTNDTQFLTDQTGNRRFWVIPCNKVDTKKLTNQRIQLLAEAKYLYDQKVDTFLSPEEFKRSEENNMDYYVRDPWESAIYQLAKTESDKGNVVKITDILQHLKPNEGSWGPGETKRVGGVLRSLGYRPKNFRKEGRVVWGWSKAEKGESKG